MRAPLVLLAVALAMAFAAGTLWLSLLEDPPGPVRREELEALVADFVAGREPAAVLDLGALLPPDSAATLLDPAMKLPRLFAYRPRDVRALARAVASCDFDEVVGIEDSHLVKVVEWHRRVCEGERGAKLPEGFFARAPWMHPAGVSYVTLARRVGLAEASGADWLARNLQYAHSGEIAELIGEEGAASAVPGGHPGAAGDLLAARGVLGGLGDAGLRALVDRDPLVLATNHLLVLASVPGSQAPAAAVPEVPPTYSAYPCAEWNAWLEPTPYRLVRHVEGEPCLARVGALCWQRDAAGFRRRTMTTLGLELAGLALLTLAVAALLLRGMREREVEAERRRFQLQVLAHEVRTPLASLSVSLEELRDAFDALPEGAQAAFLRICDDRHRLGRVVEASRQYLQAEALGGLVRMAPVTLGSAASWLDDALERAGGGVALAPPVPDRAFRTDPYWLGMCLTNLVENARRHGKPPVRVAARWDGGDLEIVVEDAGRCPAADLEEMSRPYRRATEGQGLGLGLALVRRVAAELGGGLTFAPEPTRFTLRVKEMA